MSVLRAERTGPTGFDSSEWKRAAKRVIPPSTPSSKTTSAWLRPIWGRAFGALSILTTRTGRFDRTMSIGSPVSGEADIVGGAGTVGGRACGPGAGDGKSDGPGARGGAGPGRGPPPAPGRGGAPRGGGRGLGRGAAG